VTNAARVRASWSNAPSAEDINGRDRQRLLTDPMLDMPEGAELADAEALLAAIDPIAVAAALLRLHRRQLPPPEVISAAPQPRAPEAHTSSEGRTSRYERAPRDDSRAPSPHAEGPPADFVQFRVSIGRNNRADPKWILPLLCRLGSVTKRDIGAIRIFDTDTRFEISRDVSDAFAAATANLPSNEPRITQAGDGPMPARPPFRGRPSGPRATGPRVYKKRSA
jgi:ATP-dependent RNA helicase DeaD